MLIWEPRENAGPTVIDRALLALWRMRDDPDYLYVLKGLVIAFPVFWLLFNLGD